MESATFANLGFDIIEGEQVHYLLHRRIDSGRYFLDRRLDSGTHTQNSVLYLAIDFSPSPNSNDVESTGFANVVVEVKLNLNSSHQQRNARGLELHNHASKIAGDGIIRLHRVVKEDDLLFIVRDYCEIGNLHRAITECKLFLGKDEHIRTSFLQIFDPVERIHAYGFCHGNLRPENILMGISSSGTEQFQLYDFSKFTEREHTSDFGLTPNAYMSPEQIAGILDNTGNKHTYSLPASDTWSLAMILVNMITSRQPWEMASTSDPMYKRYTKNSRFLTETLPLSEEAFQFLDHIFSTHGQTKPLARLRDDFLRIKTFYMNEEERELAHGSARHGALEWYQRVEAPPPILVTPKMYYEDAAVDSDVTDQETQMGWVSRCAGRITALLARLWRRSRVTRDI